MKYALVAILALFLTFALLIQLPSNWASAEAPNRVSAYPGPLYLPLVGKGMTGSTGAVAILANHSAFVDSYGYVHVLGEVQNQSTSHIRDVKVVVNFFNANNNLIGSDWTNIYLSNLPTGQKSCFNTFSLKLASWSYYSFDAPVYSTNGRNFRAITVVSANGYYNPSNGFYSILGQVRNDGNTTMLPEIVGTLYSSSGKVIGCMNDLVSSLGIGQVGAFDLNYTYRNYSDVTNFAIQADDFFP